MCYTRKQGCPSGRYSKPITFDGLHSMRYLFFLFRFEVLFTSGGTSSLFVLTSSDPVPAPTCAFQERTILNTLRCDTCALAGTTFAVSRSRQGAEKHAAHLSTLRGEREGRGTRKRPLLRQNASSSPEAIFYEKKTFCRQESKKMREEQP